MMNLRFVCRATLHGLPLRVGLLLIVWSVGAAGARVASAQTAADLFDDGTVQELRLSINERDLRELLERYRENVYFPADFQWRDQRVRNVGVRSRGLASRSASKPGLRIDFNRYSAGQTFLGLGSLVLDNLVTDPALVRERLSMALFTRLGQPASRESFTRLYINDVYQGIYAIVEPVDGDFLTRAFGEKSGYLFERHFLHPYLGEDLGDELTAYRSVFEPRNHELEADSVLYSAIRNLFHEVNQPVDTVWRERVGRYIDLPQLVTHVAIETFLSEADGVLGFAGMANFYLYRGPSSDRHRLIVWDKDHAFAAIDSPIFLRVEDNVLLRRALAFGDLRALYLDVLEQCARAAAADGWLEAEIVRLSALIDVAAREDVRKPYDDDTRQIAVEFLKQFARQRPSFVLQEIARERGQR
jgi:spore coat protein CotH